jgi:uncharacterized protein (TIGR03435 family)
MIRSLAWIGFTALFSGAAFGQATDAAPKFQIADIHASPPSTFQIMHGGFYAGGRYELRNATMVDLIRTAWSVDDDKVVDGPGWVLKDRFDVIGAAPADASQETLKLMLQGLLKDRFGLAVHNDTRDYSAYAMTVGKKPLLKPSEGKEESGCKVQPNTAQDPGSGGPILMMGTPNGAVRISLNEPLAFACRNITMAAFADGLRTNLVGAAQYLNNNPVEDRTELKGAWNFDIKFSFPLRGLIGAAQTGDTITLFDAFEKQLGLRLDPIKVPKPVIAIDRVNEKPTGNSPEVAERLPAPPMEFEVAAIKPTDPKVVSAAGGRGGMGIGRFFAQGGRVNIQNVTLRSLIAAAWSLSTPDLLVGGPKSLDTDHWDIVAKAPSPELAPGATAIGPAQLQVDPDSVRVMVQALLKDRFKLQVHNEDRQAPGYALVAVKPKLRKTADPTARSECKEGPGPDGKDPRIANPDAQRLVTCLNSTVAQFAVELKNTAGGYLGQYPPVLDATGIEGNYDITINFSVAGAVNGGGRGGIAAGPPGGDAAAAEPSGAITLFEALEKQLGMKLEERKVTTSALVVDHIEETPTEN